MIKIFSKIWNNEKGTALLTAMLIMGVLITISIALSSLVMREVRVTKDLMDAGKAFYAAESGVEEALYFLNNKLPGWQTDRTDADKDIPVMREFGLDGNKNKFQYVVKNQCRSYPCIDDSYNAADITSEQVGAFYDVLDLNESVLIPLFVVKNEEGTEVIKPVKNFTVEFYGGDRGENNDLLQNLKVKNVSGWDVLRWKVFGMKKEIDSQNYGTESISDFSAFASKGGKVASALYPSWFGTVACKDAPGYRVTDLIECLPYNSLSSEGGSCSAIQARDYYGLDADGNTERADCYGIDKFITDHQLEMEGSTGLNYLSLTNIMNPGMWVDDIDDKEEYSKIYFRVETYDDPTVREVAEIVSDGYAGNSKQSIQVMKKRDSYMPVFNFSIYSTYGSTNGDEQYYYDNDPTKTDQPPAIAS